LTVFCAMMDLIVGLISVACISIGLLVGLLLQNILPAHHLNEASKDTVKIGAGMLATLTALVLGLLVSSAKSSFDAMNTAIASAGAKIIMFDRILANYGPLPSPRCASAIQIVRPLESIAGQSGGSIFVL